MEASRFDFTEIMPTEVLFNICNSLTSTDLGFCASICKKMKTVCLYLLEHKRKIRLVDDVLHVIFVSLPDAGVAKSALFKTLASQKGAINRFQNQFSKPTTYYMRLETKSLRGNSRVIALNEIPNVAKNKSMTWITASHCDLCVFVVNGRSNEPKIEEDQIKELITGVCHIMSSRDVIIAININGIDPLAEKKFREKRSIITTILNKCIGPCYDVIPIDANENTGVFSSSKFAWFTGSVLWPMIVGNQTRNNYDEQAVENLRKGPFEFQIEQKCRISGVGKGVAVGRILSGSVKSSSKHMAENRENVRCIPNHETWIASIESCMTSVDTAAAGDYVALHLPQITTNELRRKYGFIWRPIDPIWQTNIPIDIAQTFRMQFVVMNSSLMGLHEVYKVHYGSHRIHCVLLWIFPSKSYKTSKDAKTMKSGTAIMVPLERVPMRVYKANEFQKNIHGKVMLTQKNGCIAAIGRIDKVIATNMDHVPMAANADYIVLYDRIINEANKLFNESERKQLDAFLQHLQNDKGAKNSVRMFQKRTSDANYYESNE